MRSPATVWTSITWRSSVVSGPGTLVNLTFSGTAIVGGSLPDGNYRLVVNGSAITDPLGAGVDADGNGTAGGPGTFSFHRLYGDADGNGTVNTADFLAFRLAFLSPNPAFDFDGSGSVDTSDFLAFRLRFLQSI